MRKLKLLLNKFAIIAPERNMSLGIIINSNEPIKWEIVNACNHRVTNNVIILLASLDCCKRDVSKLVLLLIWRFSMTNSSILRLSFFCRVFPLAVFFSHLFSFRVLFWFVLVFFSSIAVKIGPFKNSGDLNIMKSLKFGFSLFCRVLLPACFFFTCFYFVFISWWRII